MNAQDFTKRIDEIGHNIKRLEEASVIYKKIAGKESSDILQAIESERLSGKVCANKLYSFLIENQFDYVPRSDDSFVVNLFLSLQKREIGSVIVAESDEEMRKVFNVEPCYVEVTAVELTRNRYTIDSVSGKEHTIGFAKGRVLTAHDIFNISHDCTDEQYKKYLKESRLGMTYHLIVHAVVLRMKRDVPK